MNELKLLHYSERIYLGIDNLCQYQEMVLIQTQLTLHHNTFEIINSNGL